MTINKSYDNISFISELHSLIIITMRLWLLEVKLCLRLKVEYGNL